MGLNQDQRQAHESSKPNDLKLNNNKKVKQWKLKNRKRISYQVGKEGATHNSCTVDQILNFKSNLLPFDTWYVIKKNKIKHKPRT